MEPSCPAVGSTLTLERGKRRISIERIADREWRIVTADERGPLGDTRFTGDEWKAGRLFQRELDECDPNSHIRLLAPGDLPGITDVQYVDDHAEERSAK